MKFSIVIPLYNKASYIEWAIRSALAQTFADLEVIVIDDGSSDGSGELVTAIGDPRVRIVRQENAGVSVARNRGIAMAKGEWVAFLDADDWHHPQFLEMLVMAQRLHPQADMVCSTYVSIPDAQGDWPPPWALPEGAPSVELISDLPARWIQAPTVNTSTVAIRTEKLNEMQPCFAPGESFGEDVDLWLRLGETSQIALIHVPLVAYRISMEDSLTSINTQLTIPPYLLRMKHRNYDNVNHSSLKRSSLRLVSHLEITTAREALMAGERLTAINILLGATYAGRTMRWWSTAGMVFLFPSSFVGRWQSWRVSRTTQVISTG